MVTFRCTKCGKLVETSDKLWDKRWYCAPACEDCRADVETESRRYAAPWPETWHNGWRWSIRSWVEKDLTGKRKGGKISSS